MEVHKKQAHGPAGGERIRRQAELLAAARHPGVVELVGLEGGADRPVLVTVLVDGPSLAAPPALTVEEVAGVIGALATTLGDLHDMGIVHGAVAPEHVLIGPDGGPVLCGFGSAGPAGDELQPARDVAALGRLLRRLATGPDARALRRVAEAATVDDPGERPTAHDVAAAVAAAVPDARLPVPAPTAVDPALDLRALVAGARGGRRPSRSQRTAPVRPRSPLLGTDPEPGVDGDPVAPPPPARPVAVAPPARPRRTVPVRAGALAGAVVAVTAVGLVMAAPWSSPDADESRAAAPAPALVASTTRPAPTSTVAPTTSTAVVVRADCPEATAVLVADVDGDGCLDAVRYADGVLEAVGLRWSLGRAGDQVATGDWGCRGGRTVVLLRPETGEVFRFDGWAVGAQGSVTGSIVATVAGGQAVRAADVDRDGCHELVIERGELPPQVVRLPRPRP